MKTRTVVALVGLPLSGKTTLGKALGEAIGVHYVDIDQGPAVCAPPQESEPNRSEEALARERARMEVCYDVMLATVEANLRWGFSVIVSATFSNVANQERLKAIVEEGGGILKMIWCQFDDTAEEIERRIQERRSRGLGGGVRSAAHYQEVKGRFAGVQLPHLSVRVEGGQEGLHKALESALSYIG